MNIYVFIENLNYKNIKICHLNDMPYKEKYMIFFEKVIFKSYDI